MNSIAWPRARQDLRRRTAPTWYCDVCCCFVAIDMTFLRSRSIVSCCSVPCSERVSCVLNYSLWQGSENAFLDGALSVDWTITGDVITVTLAAEVCAGGMIRTRQQLTESADGRVGGHGSCKQCREHDRG